MIFGKHLNQLSSPQIKVATSAAAAAATTTTSNVCQGFAANINWYILLFDLNLCCGSGGGSCSNSGNNNNNRKRKRKRNSSSSNNNNNNNGNTNTNNINNCFSGLCSRQKLLLVSPALAVRPPACT